MRSEKDIQDRLEALRTEEKLLKQQVDSIPEQFRDHAPQKPRLAELGKEINSLEWVLGADAKKTVAV